MRMPFPGRLARLVMNSLPLVIDILDGIRYVRGERGATVST
ncbi:MAG: hypothetical protein OSB58_15810 [Alphaproteobacteria bacterium]|nr:hypothetical protein [Alphaproteobacteria bacterium]